MSESLEDKTYTQINGFKRALKNQNLKEVNRIVKEYVAKELDDKISIIAKDYLRVLSAAHLQFYLNELQNAKKKEDEGDGGGSGVSGGTRPDDGGGRGGERGNSAGGNLANGSQIRPRVSIGSSDD